MLTLHMAVPRQTSQGEYHTFEVFAIEHFYSGTRCVVVLIGDLSISFRVTCASMTFTP